MSFIEILTTDTNLINNPTWEDVENAINALDACNLTLVILAPTAPKGPPEGEMHMAIGGGKDDLCVVYMTDDNLHFWNLEDATKSPAAKRILMLIGGQEGDYREAQCVPRSWALAAAREYFERGKRSPDLPWIQG